MRRAPKSCNATAAYRTHTRGIPAAGNLTGGMVAPFQGFWVQANAASPSVRARAATTNGGVLYRGAEAGCARVLRDEACARLARAEAPPDLDVAGLDVAVAVAGNLAGTWDALDPLGRRELTCPIWGSEMEAPQGRELNTPQTPLRALLAGDFEAYGRKSKGAVSCETAPFEDGDPDET